MRSSPTVHRNFLSAMAAPCRKGVSLSLACLLALCGCMLTAEEQGNSPSIIKAKGLGLNNESVAELTSLMQKYFKGRELAYLESIIGKRNDRFTANANQEAYFGPISCAGETCIIMIGIDYDPLVPAWSIDSITVSNVPRMQKLVSGQPPSLFPTRADLNTKLQSLIGKSPQDIRLIFDTARQRKIAKLMKKLDVAEDRQITTIPTADGPSTLSVSFAEDKVSSISLAAE